MFFANIEYFLHRMLFPRVELRSENVNKIFRALLNSHTAINSLFHVSYLFALQYAWNRSVGTRQNVDAKRKMGFLHCCRRTIKTRIRVNAIRTEFAFNARYYNVIGTRMPANAAKKCWRSEPTITNRQIKQTKKSSITYLNCTEICHSKRHIDRRHDRAVSNSVFLTSRK